MSHLRNALADYLTMRRALGYKMDKAERLLGQFTAFAEDRGETHVQTETALAWAQDRIGDRPFAIATSATPQEVAELQARMGKEEASRLADGTSARIASGLVERGIRRLVPRMDQLFKIDKACWVGLPESSGFFQSSSLSSSYTMAKYRSSSMDPSRTLQEYSYSRYPGDVTEIKFAVVIMSRSDSARLKSAVSMTSRRFESFMAATSSAIITEGLKPSKHWKLFDKGRRTDAFGLYSSETLYVVTSSVSLADLAT